MQWTDEALILSVRPHGETAAVVELLSRTNGRFLALVHGGQSRTRKAMLQPGSHVDATWKARLEAHLGHVTLELRKAYAATALDSPGALAALASMATLVRELPERDPHPSLFEITLFVMSFLDDDASWPALYVRWEVALLAELGFGLDLTRCAATGVTEDLVWVSPRTGRAVSRAAGEPYRDKLLALPAFLRRRRVGDPAVVVTPADVADGLRLTEHFLKCRIFEPRGAELPVHRRRLADILAKPARPV